MRVWWLSVGLALALAGCATSAPVKTVQYQGAVSVSSDKRALIRLNRGQVAAGWSSEQGEQVVPVARGPDPSLRFHRQDQAHFVQSLSRELERLGLFDSVQVDGDRGRDRDVVIEILFTETRHLPELQQYVLDVVLLVGSDSNAMAAKYRVVADVEDSVWSAAAHEAAAGKRQAAQNLMDFLIPDIQEFLKRMDRPRAAPIVLTRRIAP